MKENHTRLLKRARFILPEYLKELTPEMIKEKILTTEGRMGLRELIRDLSDELQVMKDLI